MPYVKRTNGIVTCIYACLQPGIAPTYRQLRAAAYPPMADYLDAVVKNDVVALQAYKDACMAVKVEYPQARLNHDT